MFKYGKLILCFTFLSFSVFSASLSYANFDKNNSDQKSSNVQEYSILSYNLENIFKDSKVTIEENNGPWFKININGKSSWIHKDLFPVEILKASLETKALAKDEASTDKPQDSKEEEQKNTETVVAKADESEETESSTEATEESSGEKETSSKTTVASVSVEGVITGDDVNVRKGSGTNHGIITQVNTGDVVEILGKTDDWYNVKTEDGVTGWVYGTYVSVGSTLASRGETSNTNSSKRAQIISYAKELLGVRYVYGGSTPSGFDCSGFVWYVFNHFGIKLNRVAADQAKQGTKISRSELQLGDLVFFDTNGGKDYINHVGIYIGNGSFIHASSGSKAKKVVISELNSGFYNDCYMTARKILD